MTKGQPGHQVQVFARGSHSNELSLPFESLGVCAGGLFTSTLFATQAACLMMVTHHASCGVSSCGISKSLRCLLRACSQRHQARRWPLGEQHARKVSCVAANVDTGCDLGRNVLHHSTVGEQALSEMHGVFVGHCCATADAACACA